MDKRHILIVEDELQIAVSLCRALEYHLDGSCEIAISPQASDALVQLQDRHFDLIVTDLRMAGMSGLELIQRVHRDSPQTRTMLITAFGSPKVEQQARRLAAIYLPKPFRLQEFIAAVRSILEAIDQGAGTRQPSKLGG
jgi:two-component system response regulator (stage 0 sporulation protein F)